VHAALDLGVNFFDVSPYYGATTAETALGKAMRGVGRSRYLLATKVGRYGDEDFDFNAGRVNRSVRESLGRLGTDHVDLIQCHDIEFGDLDQIVDETVPALRDIQAAGLARFVVVPGYPIPALAYVADRALIDTILSYCQYTPLDRRLAQWRDRLAARGVGVINASPLAMGALTSRGAPSWHPAPASVAAFADASLPTGGSGSVAAAT
jgi:L-galactose dehydrogenase